MINFLSGPIVYALVAAIAFAMGWQVNGWRMGETLAEWQLEIADARAEQNRQARITESVRRENIVIAGELKAERERKQETIETVITEEVIRYVQEDRSDCCGVDRDGVRLINAAAAGRVPSTGAARSRVNATASRPAVTPGSFDIVRGVGPVCYSELCTVPTHGEQIAIAAGVGKCSTVGGPG